MGKKIRAPVKIFIRKEMKKIKLYSFFLKKILKLDTQKSEHKLQVVDVTTNKGGIL